MSERFDLLDQTQVVTQPFTQDLVGYALPRSAVGGASAPRSDHAVAQLYDPGTDAWRRGLDVTPFVLPRPGPSRFRRGTVTSNEGDTLQVPSGALAGNTPVGLRRLTAANAGVTVPAGLDLIAAIQVDMVGVTLATPAQLSTAAPDGLGTRIRSSSRACSPTPSGRAVSSSWPSAN